MDAIKIGKFIQQERKQLGYTQRQLADALSVSDKTVSKWENGNGIPDVSLLLPLCGVFGISANELLAGERLSEGDYRDKAEETIVNLMQAQQLASLQPVKALWKSLARICLCYVAIPLLLATILCSFISPQAVEPLVINVEVWLLLGITCTILACRENIQRKARKENGRTFPGEIIKLLPSPYFQIGNYVTCRLQCSYFDGSRNRSAKSGLILLTHFDRKENLLVKIYQDWEYPEKCSMEIFRKE